MESRHPGERRDRAPGFWAGLGRLDPGL